MIMERNKRGTEDIGIKERKHSFIPLKPFTYSSLPIISGRWLGIYLMEMPWPLLNIFDVIYSARQMTLGRWADHRGQSEALMELRMGRGKRK